MRIVRVGSKQGVGYNLRGGPPRTRKKRINQRHIFIDGGEKENKKE